MHTAATYVIEHCTNKAECLTLQPKQPVEFDQAINYVNKIKVCDGTLRNQPRVAVGFDGNHKYVHMSAMLNYV